SGVIVSPDGYMITNNHVVEHADQIRVLLSDKRKFEGEVVGTDPKTDLALIKIDADDLPAIRWGDSSQLKVGELVMAIGTPFGLNQTVTMGIISAVGRANVGIVDYEDFIQTDAAINPGNSGGPLFNVRGEVIGINTAIISQSGGNNGIGFAIPINLAKSVFKDLRENGHVRRARLGVRIQDIDKATMQALGLKSRAGALVPQVEAGSAADKAGIQAGDVIVAIDGEMIRKSHDLPIKIARHAPGDKVEVEVIRDAQRQTITVIVEAMPDDMASQSNKGKKKSLAQHGMTVEPLSKSLAEKLRTRSAYGVVVKQVRRGSAAAGAGIQRGDVVVRIDGFEIKNIRAFEKHAANLSQGHALRVLLDRQGNQVFTIILPAKDK
ncbi:MAG: Do family serine endopeptidase, partial [Mariprofundaceae bacterium]|nr:Do family serine endopeptidase [Mariprofundaceae bacterium]